MLNPKITVPFGCVWLDLLIFELEVRNIWPFAPGRTFIRFLLQNCDILCKYDNPVYHFKDNFMLNPKITVPFGCVWLDLLIFEIEVRNIWPFGPGRTFIHFLLQNCDTLSKYDNPVYYFKDKFVIFGRWAPARLLVIFYYKIAIHCAI